VSALQAEIAVDVPGIPVPQGSVRAFKAKSGKVVTQNDPTGSIERWRGDIRSALRGLVPGVLVSEPVAMRLSFRFPRPAAHYLPANQSRREPELRLDAPHWKASEPDVDKLARAVLDALTGVVYADDALVTSIVAAKRYVSEGEVPGLRLELRDAGSPR
jgi:crossover junction endodeoxyribonuclease RusA